MLFRLSGIQQHCMLGLLRDVTALFFSEVRLRTDSSWYMDSKQKTQKTAQYNEN